MAIRNKNIYSVNLTDMAVEALQLAGILDKKKKKKKGFNLSQFISKTIVSYVENHKESNPDTIMINLLLKEMEDIDKERKKLDNEAIKVADKIKKIKGDETK